MKVLYIADPVTIGGASKSLLDIVTEMKYKGVECTVCLSQDDEYSEHLKHEGVTCVITHHMAAMEVASRKRFKKIFVYLYRSILYRQCLHRAVKIIESKIDIGSFDVIHTNSARNDIGGVLAKKYKIPHIVHIREFGDADFDCWCYKRNYISFLNSSCTKFIAISKAVKQYWAGKGLDAERIDVIYNGVDNAAILKKEKYIANNERLKLVIVGGICEAKGQMEIVRALAKVPKQIQKKISLSIVGWGNEQYITDIKQYAEKHTVASKMIFLGAREDVYDLLQTYDVGLMCSKSEGFGRVTIEYMHAGLAVIASNTGANEEIVDDGETGLIYEYGNSQELANKITELFENRNELKSLAIKGQEKAQKYFTKEINAEKVYSEYISVIGAERNRAVLNE